VESARVSGKVFRFLSTMHPSLSKKERARYADIDADSWVPWTPEIAAEFSDLVKRSPRDPAFAKGLAYVAQKGLPDGSNVAPQDLLANLDRLPTGFSSERGNGYSVTADGPRSGVVAYDGMPDFSNACIAVVGELTQRFTAAGAIGIGVKHVSPCRLQGGSQCRFELSWNSDSDSVAGNRVTVDELFGARDAAAAEPSAVSPAAVPAPEPAKPQAAPARPAPARKQSSAPPPPPPAPAPAAAAAVRTPAPSPAQPVGADGSSQDLFEQLRARLLESETQAQHHAALEARIQERDLELARARSEFDAALATANHATELARYELNELKQHLRELIGDG
jgi:hypothetical protein